MRPVNSALAICLALLIGTLAMTGAGAQNQGNDEYLPPWQRGGGGAAEEPAAPERISPPASTGGYEKEPYEERRREARPNRDERHERPNYDAYDDEDTYSTNEIVEAGHLFFGGISKSLAKVVEYAFQKQGRPNGYILGEEAGGAFIAGLRYGEGTLNTKNAGRHTVFWQGPSVGYDFGAEGSKTMILVYNLKYVEQIYNRFAGIDGSAYLVGGVGITFQTYDDMVLAPIRSGVGLRLGANVGYLKYTRTRSWNPF
jgi:hypothetical protein